VNGVQICPVGATVLLVACTVFGVIAGLCVLIPRRVQRFFLSLEKYRTSGLGRDISGPRYVILLRLWGMFALGLVAVILYFLIQSILG
jgi:hypothetical protein